jgi:hypothetical protein
MNHCTEFSLRITELCSVGYRTHMDFPDFQSDQHALMAAEVETGIVLNLCGKRWRKDEPTPYWRVFESFAAAREFAVVEVGNTPEVEFVIYDREQKPIEIVRHEKYNHLDFGPRFN